jgi:ABC-type uncharacterized transport system ATPase subunit
MDITS